MRYALVVNDLNEVAGRGGMGAVMGSKNLKAIAVRGTKKVPVADPKTRPGDGHVGQRHDGRGPLQLPSLRHWRRRWSASTWKGHMIVRNFQDGQWDPEKIKRSTPRPSPRPTATRWMAATPVRCAARSASRTRRLGVLPRFGGPEYETHRRGRHEPRPSATCRCHAAQPAR